MTLQDDERRASGRAASTRGEGSPRSASLPASKLIATTIEVYEAWRPERLTLDSHLAKDLAARASSLRSASDTAFVKQCVYGLARYAKLLSRFLEAFYDSNSGTASREDGSLYRLFVYLACFRLEELTFPAFRRLVATQPAQKLLVLLEYLWDERAMQEVVREEWLKLYDKPFVDATIERLFAWQPDSGQLLTQLRQQVFFTAQSEGSGDVSVPDANSSSGARGSGKSSAAGTRKAFVPTKPQPFNLTPVRPRAPPIDPLSLVPPGPKPRPPPPRRDGPTPEEVALAAAREANRRAAEELAATAPPRLRTLERPSNTEALKAAAEAQLHAELATRAKPTPVPPPPTAGVKLNTAAILREDALYRRKQEQEAAALQRFEAELRDMRQYSQWRADMKLADKTAEAARVALLREQMSTAAGAATQAKQDLLTARQREGMVEKAERQKRSERLQREREQELAEKAKLAETVAAERVKAEQAQERVRQERKQSADAVRQAAEQALRDRAEELAREAAEKRDIILQLRALERAPKMRFKSFDPTEVTDVGTMDQMSLSELRARLVLARQRQQEEEDRQRAEILAKRQEKEGVLVEKVERIARIRRLASAQAQLRKAAQEAERARTADEVQRRSDAMALELHARLEAKHAAAAAERARIAAEEKRVKFEQMQSAAGAAAVEETKFRELRQGKQRTTQQRQVTKRLEASVHASTQQREQNVRLTALRSQQRSREDFLAAYDAKIASLTQTNLKEAEADLQRRAHLTSARRVQESSRRQAAEESAKLRPVPPSQQERLAMLVAGKLEL